MQGLHSRVALGLVCTIALRHRFLTSDVQVFRVLCLRLLVSPSMASSEYGLVALKLNALMGLPVDLVLARLGVPILGPTLPRCLRALRISLARLGVPCFRVYTSARP